jgi:hypothetical protein
MLDGGKDSRLAISYLNSAIDKVLEAVASLPPPQANLLFADLANLVQQIEKSLPDINELPEDEIEIYQALVARIHTLNSLLGVAQEQEVTPEPTQLERILLPIIGNMANGEVPTQGQIGLNPSSIIFPPGSPGALHAFFPLTGAHSTVSCNACHIDARYAGTPNTCEACHAVVRPVDHYTGDCAACHTTSSWLEINFDHSLAGSNDCISCHTNDKPAGH